jgi:heptosyltransferase-1
LNAADQRTIGRLLIVRLSAMGDVIHTLPAAEALRRTFPQAMMGWLIEERWAELLCAPAAARRGARSGERPLVDWVHTVNLKAWGRSPVSIHTLEEIARVWNDVRSARYEIAVDLQGAIRSAVLASWSGAPVVYGAREPREGPAGLWYTRQATAQGTHVIEQGLSLVEALAGKKMDVPVVDFPRDARAEEKIGRQLRQADIGEFAILNPGAGWGAKQWPAERYGYLARALARCGLQSIVNYGPGEQDLARRTERASDGGARALECSVTELIALTRRAKLFVGGDTGPMHLAAALKVPVVAIFGPTDPARNGPYGTPSVVLRNPSSTTTHARNPHSDEAMLAIDVEAVIAAARTLLSPTPVETRRG